MYSIHSPGMPLPHCARACMCTWVHMHAALTHAHNVCTALEHVSTQMCIHSRIAIMSACTGGSHTTHEQCAKRLICFAIFNSARSPKTCLAPNSKLLCTKTPPKLVQSSNHEYQTTTIYIIRQIIGRLDSIWSLHNWTHEQRLNLCKALHL